jgi:NitT/TauT family transport system substrate-binding protein
VAFSGAHAQTKVNLRLDWTFYGTHAPFYLGIEKGLYKAEGIDLVIGEGNGSGNTAKQLAQGGDQVGFLDYGTMTKGIASGMPIKAIMGVHQRSPMIIVSHADQPIKSPKELEGKIIAFAPAESTAQMYPVMMALAGADPTKVNVIAPAVGAKSALFLQRRTDAITATSYFHVPQLEAQGAKLSYFYYADFGVAALEGGLAANAEWLKENGETAKKLVAATVKAFAMAKADPGAAVDAAVKLRPELARTRDVHVRQLQLSIDAWSTANTKGMPFGRMSEQDWQTMVDQLVESKQIKEKLPLDKLFTNELVPG